MEQPQLLQVPQAAPAGRHLAVDCAIEATMLARSTAERPNQGHITDDVDHLTGNLSGVSIVPQPGMLG